MTRARRVSGWLAPRVRAHAGEGAGLGVKGAVVGGGEVRVEGLLAEVGASQEARVEAGGAHHPLELGGVEAVRATGDHDAIEVVAGNGLADGVAAVWGAGVGHGLSQGHAGQGLRPLEELGNANRVQLAVAIAEKDANPGLLVRDVAEAGSDGGRFSRLGPGIEERGDLGSGGSGFGDGIGDVFWLAEGAGEKEAGAVGAGGVVGDGLSKAIVVELEAELLGQVLHALGWGKAGGEDEEVEAVLVEAGVLADRGDEEVTGLLELADVGGHGAAVGHAGQGLDLVDVGLEILAKGAEVHEKDGDLEGRVELFGQGDLLGGEHAAGGGAMARAAEVVAGADAVDKGDVLRREAVGRASQVSDGGAGEADHALELEGGEDVVIDAESVLALEACVKGSKARGEQERPGGDLIIAVGHVEVDGAGGAGLDAAAAFSAGVHVDEPGVGDGAEAWGAVDSPGGREPALVVVGAGLGADVGAEAAAVAEVGVDKAGLVADGGGEAAGQTVEVCELGVGEEGDVGVEVALEGGAECGLLGQHEADAAGVGGEGVVEEVHGAADGGSGVEEVDVEAEVGEVGSGGHTGDASTGDEDRVARVDRG